MESSSVVAAAFSPGMQPAMPVSMVPWLQEDAGGLLLPAT